MCQNAKVSKCRFDHPLKQINLMGNVPTESLKGKANKTTIATPLSLPDLPRDVWAIIFNLRTTRMLFEKCLREIQNIEYYTISSCNIDNLQQGPSDIMSTAIHRGKKVTHRLRLTNFGSQMKNGYHSSTYLYVQRTWLETKFQVRFKTVAQMWLVDLPCPDSGEWGITAASSFSVAVGHVTNFGTNWPFPRAVRVEVEGNYPSSKIPWPKQPTPVIKHDQITQQTHHASAQAFGQI